MSEQKAPTIKQWLIFFVGSIFVYFYACGGEKNKDLQDDVSTPQATNSTKSDQSKAEDATSKKVDLRLGKDYAIVEDVTVAKTEKDFDELQEFVTAQDFDGWKLLREEKIVQERAFPIGKGTQVRVISISWFTAKIRVLEGVHANQIGYIDHEFIRGFNN